MRGRPRTFDVDKALDRAMKVFWRKGYEGTSLPDLTLAMGINRPSLYAAFGNKESLYRKVLDRYAGGPASYVCRALEAPTARAVAEQLLEGTVDTLTNPRNPGGCLFVQGATGCSEAAEPIRREMVARRNAGEEALRMRFERAVAERDLPRKVNPADLARYIVTLARGMSIQSASGASREELQRVVKMAMRAWPSA